MQEVEAIQKSHVLWVFLGENHKPYKKSDRMIIYVGFPVVASSLREPDQQLLHLLKALSLRFSFRRFSSNCNRGTSWYSRSCILLRCSQCFISSFNLRRWMAHVFAKQWLLLHFGQSLSIQPPKRQKLCSSNPKPRWSLAMKSPMFPAWGLKSSTQRYLEARRCRRCQALFIYRRCQSLTLIC